MNLIEMFSLVFFFGLIALIYSEWVYRVYRKESKRLKDSTDVELQTKQQKEMAHAKSNLNFIRSGMIFLIILFIAIIGDYLLSK